MVDALTSKGMSPELLKVAERAKREPEGKFHSLAHLLTEESLERAFHRQRNNAAVGVDGVTKELYGQDLFGKSEGTAREDEGEAVPPSACPTCPHPEGEGQNAADRNLDRGGQNRPRGAARSVGGNLRAGFSATVRTASDPDAVPTTRYVLLTGWRRKARRTGCWKRMSRSFSPASIARC